LTFCFNVSATIIAAHRQRNNPGWEQKFRVISSTRAANMQKIEGTNPG
jgi:hypothetical protein